MNDFENRLSQLLNEDVDHRLGTERPAPPLHAPRAGSRAATSRRRSKWLPPLLAAACIALLAAGTAAGTQLLSSPAPVAPATLIPATGSAVPPTPAPAPATTPGSVTPTTPTSAAVPTRAASGSGTGSSGPSSGTTASLDGATIALPAGWAARKQDGPSGVTTWCLQARTAGDGVCAVVLRQLRTVSSSIDLDRQGFEFGDPPQYICGQSALSPTERLTTATFGKRDAELREFDRTCASSGRTFRTVQYFVPTAPAWALSVDGATPADRAVAQRIVNDSTLPDQSAPLRLLDRGTIRSVSRGQSGVRVTIARTRFDFGRQRFVDAGASVRYLVPTTTYDRAGVKTGGRVTVHTDGRVVTSFDADPRA